MTALRVTFGVAPVLSNAMFTVSASQKAKARMVAETYGVRFTLDMYRRELDFAIEMIWWVASRAA